MSASPHFIQKIQRIYDRLRGATYNGTINESIDALTERLADLTEDSFTPDGKLKAVKVEGSPFEPAGPGEVVRVRSPEDGVVQLAINSPLEEVNHFGDGSDVFVELTPASPGHFQWNGQGGEFNNVNDAATELANFLQGFFGLSATASGNVVTITYPGQVAPAWSGNAGTITVIHPGYNGSVAPALLSGLNVGDKLKFGEDYQIHARFLEGEPSFHLLGQNFEQYVQTYAKGFVASLPYGFSHNGIVAFGKFVGFQGTPSHQFEIAGRNCLGFIGPPNGAEEWLPLNVKVYLDLNEVPTATPPNPLPNRARVFARDNGSGKTQLCVRFASGAVQVLATEP